MLVILAAFGGYSIFQARVQTEKNFIHTLKTYTDDMNGVCPIPVGGSTDLVIQKVYLLEEKTVVYEYRLLTYDKNSLDIPRLKESLSDPLIAELESMKSLEILKNKNVVFEYCFFDHENEELFKIRMLFNTPIKIMG